jgi:hypothetical protein
MRPLTHLRLVVLLFSLMSVLIPQGLASAQTAERCFPETGFCMSGRIREFWEKNGGLQVFGFPIGPQKEELIEGKPFQVQRFERNRLELHPENARPYDVLLGRLGADRLAQLGKDWQAYPKSGQQEGCRYFPETNQSVCGNILRAWRASGLEIDGKSGKTEAENTALFGLPLSPLVTERQADGKERQIQWFERARFELHPENQAPYDVLLGLLGNEIRDGGVPATPPPAAAPPVEPSLPASIDAIVLPDTGPRGTVFSAAAYGFAPGEQVGVYITRPNTSVFGAPFQVEADDEGVTEGVTFTTRSDSDLGVWAITFEGVESGHKGIGYFKVTDAGSAAAPAPSGPLPASTNSTVSPERGGRGTVFEIIGRGFQPGEAVGVYATAPDRSVYGAPFQVSAESDGTVSVTFTATSDVPPGVWANTFEGVSSGHKAVAYFEITP